MVSWGHLALAPLALLVAVRAPAQPVPAAFGTTALPAPEADEPIRTSFYLTLRDGVRVAVDLYRPAKGGKPVAGRFPVVWHHTIDRNLRSPDGANRTEGNDLGLGNAPVLARYGYVVAQVDRRGTGASFGARRGYHDRNEAFDAYEISEWLATQSWSDGKVGLFGCSNTGDAAMQAATVAPPHLKAIFAGCFSWNKYDAMMRGGIFAQWGTGPTRTIEQDMTARPVDADAGKLLLRQAAEEHQRGTSLLDMWSGMPFRDSWSPLVASRFWSEGSTSAYADVVRRSGISFYILGGWKDDYRKEGLVTFANLPTGKRRILIGDWEHCRNDGFNLLAEVKRFFDVELKGQAPLADPPIHYFMVHAPAGNAWRSAATWPLPNAAPQTLALTASRLLARAGAAGKAAVNYKPAPICPGMPAARKVPTMLAYWLACPDPEGAASFDAAPVDRDTEVVGSPLAELALRVDAADADAFVYLQDVAPDGSVETMTEGRLRLSLRQTSTPPYTTIDLPWRRAFAEDAQPLTAGAESRVTVDLLPVAWNMRAGHRLRLLVTASDYRERRPEDGGRGFSILTGAGGSRLVLPTLG